MNYTMLTYLLYLPFGLGIAWLTGQSLFKNGYPLLFEVFGGKAELAGSVNRLLIAGFYLLTIGYISLRLPVEGEILTTAGMFEVLSTKLGILLLILGGAHILVMATLFRMRKPLRSVPS